MAKEKGQTEKQRYTKYTHKTKDQVTRTPIKTHFKAKIFDSELFPLRRGEMVHDRRGNMEGTVFL